MCQMGDGIFPWVGIKSCPSGHLQTAASSLAKPWILHSRLGKKVSKACMCNIYPVLLWASGSHGRPLLPTHSPITVFTKDTTSFLDPFSQLFPNDLWVARVPFATCGLTWDTTSLYQAILCWGHLTAEFPNTSWQSDVFPEVNVDSNQLEIQPLPCRSLDLWLKHGDRYLDFWSAVGMLMTFMWGMNCKCDRTHYL